MPAEAGLERAFEVIRRRVWVGALVFAAAVSVAGPFPLFLPNLYRATATVVVDRQEVQNSVVRPAVSELDIRLATIRQALLSRERLTALIDQYGLYPELQDHVPLDAVVERMRQDVDIRLTEADSAGGRASTIGVTVSYLGADPEQAATVANRLASFYLERDTLIREEQAGEAAAFLETALAAVRDELGSHQQRIDRFKAQHLGELPEQVPAILATIERLNTQLRLNHEQQLRVIERRESLVEQLVNLETTGSAAAPEASAAELVELRRQLLDLQSRFTSRHPDVIVVRTRMAELERERDGVDRDEAEPAAHAAAGPGARRFEAALANADVELADLEQAAADLKRTLTTYEQRIQSAPTRGQELQALTRDHAMVSERYQTLLRRYEEAELAERLERADSGQAFHILDPALPPTQPAAPSRIRLLAMVLILAGAAAVVGVLAAEQLDFSFRTTDELRQFTDIAVLATIPFIRTRRRPVAYLIGLGFAAAAVALCTLLATGAYHLADGNTELTRILSR